MVVGRGPRTRRKVDGCRERSRPPLRVASPFPIGGTQGTLTSVPYGSWFDKLTTRQAHHSTGSPLDKLTTRQAHHSTGSSLGRLTVTKPPPAPPPAGDKMRVLNNCNFCHFDPSCVISTEGRNPCPECNEGSLDFSVASLLRNDIRRRSRSSK